jgi:hypothetical protein
VPARSRVTLRRSPAPLARSAPLAAAALSDSRVALTQLVGQLDTILAKLRDPAASLDRDAPDKLRAAAAAVGAALARARRAPAP